MRKVAICLLALFCMAALAPASAFAHMGGAHTGSFAHGFVHPLDGLDHILLIAAVGVWAVRVASRARWAVPAAFAGALAAAGLFAAYHSLVNGAGGLSYVGGVLLATALLNACGAGAGLLLKRYDRFFLARHAGPILAAIGVTLFFL